MSLIVLGTVALDTVKTPHGKKTNMLGGSAAHFSMAARFFIPVNLVAVVGEDFPSEHIDFLRRKGIVTASLKKESGRTFRWEGEYHGDMNAALTLNTELGVLSAFHPEITDEQKKMKYIFLANVDPDIQAKLLDSIHSPKLVALDSMNYWIKHKQKSLLKLLKRVDIFVANDAEAKELSAKHSLFEAAVALRKLGPKMIVIKKGEHGVLFYSDELSFSLPAYPVRKLVDPTGAGDSFAGGFMGYLAKAQAVNKKTIKKAVGYGTVIASYNVEGFGLERTSGLTLKEINSRFAAYRNNLIL
ncbi:MAG: sugar kinase [Omnitrophica WOR_2 bacterium GWF2_43_52]|nr:MAG: sugar kinase [Omnitrophica WOR_2 bacterium GWA2_44_7]OGX18197.1 MAG: sugar kinase [Omnitrophica WOR_2 bacterium GWC2_44_8]OGX21006.1 MAG: sugar kinase [Omnitrophica WOR_2 bacterium GWF2_43_52]OGX58362.1 MAG: sugar kinase [Omnitrophica WOR_2 bacterium RIFOXYC2_FULL_43_9]HAH21185.1 sugar kinase [Candidatus Omnitrophota bacterium]